METLIEMLAVPALLLGGYASWKVWTLSREVSRLKREQYYVDSRLKRLPDELVSAVDPLRRQVANIVAGRPVNVDLVLSGAVYVDIRASDLQAVLEASQHAPEKIALIDVRTPKEFAARRIPGATLVPFEELDKRYLDDVPITAERVYVYCASGERSRLASDFLGRRGYTNVYNVQDGLRGWSGRTEGEGEVTFIKLESKR